jgi:hypothetical protein
MSDANSSLDRVPERKWDLILEEKDKFRKIEFVRKNEIVTGVWTFRKWENRRETGMHEVGRVAPRPLSLSR